MRLFFHPNGVKPLVANWNAIAPLLWHRARREADALGGQEMKAVLADPAFKEKFLAPSFFEPIKGSPDQFASFIQNEAAKWSKVIKDANLTLE